MSARARGISERNLHEKARAGMLDGEPTVEVATPRAEGGLNVAVRFPNAG
jgi:hypothetical protein